MLTRPFIETKIAQRPVLLIAKDTDPISKEIAKALEVYDLNNGKYIFEVLNIAQRQDVWIIDTFIYQKWLTKCRMVSLR